MNRRAVMSNWPLIKNAIKFTDRLKLCKFLLMSDRYTNGPIVRQFEEQWSNWIGSKRSLMVSSGSTANFLLLAAIKEKNNLKNGDKVLVPACTWVTNISPVIQLGFEPIFCDVNLTNFSFDLDHLEQIKKKHDIKVIFITHLLGFSAENEKYKSLFPNAIILEDVCESHGCTSETGELRGRDNGTFSFYFGHHMTTVEGGIITTNDNDLYEIMRMKRSHGLARESGNLYKYTQKYSNIHPQFLFVTDGYNFRSTEINAILGIQQLPRLDKFIKIRRNNFTHFINNIIEKNLHLFYPINNQNGNSNYALPFICRSVEVKNKLINLFNLNKIEHRPIVGGNLLKQPFLFKYDFGVKRKHYNVDIINDNGLYIGNSQFIKLCQIDKLSDLIKTKI